MQENKKQAVQTEEKAVEASVAAKKPAKTATKKASTKAKTSADKATSTRKTLKTSFFIQHEGREVEDKEIIAKIKETWVSELGNKISDMKTLTTYIKPEEQSIYYVINDSINGRIDF